MLKKTITPLFLLSVLFASQGVFAKSNPQEGYAYQDITEIKKQVSGLLEENRQLKAQHENLRNELNMLQSKVDNARKNLSGAEKRTLDKRQKYRMSGEIVKIFDGDVNRLKNEILIQKSKESFLKAKLIDYDKEIELWKLKSKKAKYEIRQLELKIKRKQFQVSEQNKDKSDISQQLNDEITQAKKKKEELLNEINEINAQSSTYPELIIELQKSNFELQKQLTKISSQQRIKDKEVAILQDKKILKELEFKKDFEDYEFERRKLRNNVEQLDQDYNALNNMVDLSLTKKSEKRVIMQDIINLDKENQILLQKIQSIQEPNTKN